MFGYTDRNSFTMKCNPSSSIIANLDWLLRRRRFEYAGTRYDTVRGRNLDCKLEPIPGREQDTTAIKHQNPPRTNSTSQQVATPHRSITAGLPKNCASA